MLLKDAFKTLSRSHLQALAVGGLGTGVIPDEYKPLIISHINAGLRDLFAEFPLKTKEVIVNLRENIARYYLRPDYARSNDKSPIAEQRRYIDDLGSPFKGDVLRILEIYNKEGRLQYKNDAPICLGLTLPEFDCIHVPLPRNGETLFVTYSASHDEIPEDADQETTLINIPASHEEALFCFVAQREYGSMTGERQVMKAQEFLNKYGYQCDRIKQLNLDNDSYSGTNVRFRARGFV